MKKFSKLLALLLALTLFALMALGSGSSSSSDSKGSGEQSASETGAAAPSGQQEAEGAAGEADSAEEKAAEGSPQSPDPQAQQSAKEEAAWETGEGIVNTYTDSIGSNWVRIALPVRNTGNTDLYLSAGTMDLEDADGHLVDSKSLISVYPQVIKPGETAWYFDDTTLEESPASPLSLVPHVDVKKASAACVRYEVSDVSFTDETYGGIKVTGRIENTSDAEESWINVAVLLYDENEQFLGVIRTYVTETVQPGDKIGFSATSLSNYDQLTVSDIAQYRIYAYPEQFQF